jgi:hypothetical protein
VKGKEIEEVEEEKELGTEVVVGAMAMKRRSSEYSQDMIGQVVEIVNMLSQFYYLGIGHNSMAIRGSRKQERNPQSDPRTASC